MRMDLKMKKNDAGAGRRGMGCFRLFKGMRNTEVILCSLP